MLKLGIIFFIYGLTFFSMGITILAQPRRGSAFRLSEVILFLALFGLSHGANEWLDLLVIVKGDNPNSLLGVVATLVLVASYVFLLEFGRRLASLSVKGFPPKWTTVALSILTFVCILIFRQNSSIWPRYLLCFPGGLLAASGFILYYHKNRSVLEPIGVHTHFWAATFSMGIYSILGGLVVPRADFFPASLINNASFLYLTGVPVQVFRALCAIFLWWSIWHILGIFSWETTQQLKNSLEVASAARSYTDSIIKSMADGLIVFNPNLEIRAVNNSACQLLGYREGELIGMSAREIFSSQAPFEGTKFKKLLEDGQLSNYELTCLSKDGLTVSLLFSAAVMRAPKGEVSGIIGVVKDIGELKVLQDRLSRAERLATIGRVASLIGHEFRNQLGVMNNAVYFLKMKLGTKDEKVKKHLWILEREIVATEMIIENIQTFAITKRPELKNISLTDLLSVSIEKIRIPEGITVVKQIDDGLPKVLADEIQLGRVLINIILNSVEAMGDKGKLSIRASRIDSCIAVALEDTGCGIKKEDLRYIFEPFFSTKPKGIGLGLATAKVIVEAHGGTIDIESEVGRGTIITIKLPI